MMESTKEVERSLNFMEIEEELALALLENEDAEDLSDEQRQEVIAIYMQGALEKRDRIARAYRVLEMQEEFAKKEIERLQARKQRVGTAKERLSAYIQAVGQKLGATKFQGATSTITIQKNSSRGTIIEDEAAVPAKFKIIETVTSIDKASLNAALLRGEAIDGAKLAEVGYHVRVR